MGTGNLKITDGYLTDFAQKKLNGLVTDMTTNTYVTQLAEFASGLPSGATPGGDMTVGYNQVLPGSADSTVGNAATLQANFTKYASALAGQIQSLATNARTMSYDLLQVDSVLADSDDHANITADEMNADLQNLNFGGSGTPGTGNPGSTTT
jgi:hypothetical protein